MRSGVLPVGLRISRHTVRRPCETHTATSRHRATVASVLPEVPPAPPAQHRRGARGRQDRRSRPPWGCPSCRWTASTTPTSSWSAADCWTARVPGDLRSRVRRAAAPGPCRRGRRRRTGVRARPRAAARGRDLRAPDGTVVTEGTTCCSTSRAGMPYGGSRTSSGTVADGGAGSGWSRGTWSSARRRTGRGLGGRVDGGQRATGRGGSRPCRPGRRPQRLGSGELPGVRPVTAREVADRSGPGRRSRGRRRPGEVRSLLAGEPLGRLVQAPALDQPLRGQADAPGGEPLQRALGDRAELLADLAHPLDLGVALDPLDDRVDEQTLLVDGQHRPQRLLDGGDRRPAGGRGHRVVADGRPDRRHERVVGERDRCGR